MAAAIALADADGLDAVSMRRVAAALGVVPMALYNHVEHKDDLLDAMVEAVVAAYPPPDPDLDWRSQVRDRVLAARRAIAQHGWLRALIEGRTRRTPAVLDHMEALSAAFMSGGISPQLAHHAMHALGHRIWGFSPEAFDDPDGPRLPDDPAERDAAVEQFSQRYPAIIAIATTATNPSGTPECDADFEFDFALDLILDGVERLHAQGWRPD